MTDKQTIALIGFSEVGQAFAAGLAAAGAHVRASDLRAGDDDLLAAAQTLGISLSDRARDAAAGADLVVSAVTARAALPVANDAADWLRPGQVYLDVNSTGPADKQACAAVVARSGAKFVEAAIMSPVAPHGHAVPMLVAGPDAPDAAGLLNPLGMNLTVAGAGFGAASAAKMCRSIVMKGIEAIVVESLLTARAWDVDDLVLASLAETYPGVDWQDRAGYLFSRVMDHGRRRAEELRQARDVVQASGYRGVMAAAIAELQDWAADRAADRLGSAQPVVAGDYRTLADALADAAPSSRGE